MKEEEFFRKKGEGESPVPDSTLGLGGKRPPDIPLSLLHQNLLFYYPGAAALWAAETGGDTARAREETARESI